MEEINKEFEILLIEQDLTIKEFATDMCNVIVKHFGTHNYQIVKDIVNSKLTEK